MANNDSDNLQTFSLRNKEEVEKVSQLLGEYFKSLAGFTTDLISLTKAYEKLQGHQEGGRIFTALLDLHINLQLLQLDMGRFTGEWNQYYSTEIFKGGGSILDSKERFFSKMRAHQYASAFILKYRAVWDKLMGILILEAIS